MTSVTARDDEADIGVRHGHWVQLRLTRAAGGVAATQLVCRPDRPSRVLSSVPAPEGRSLIARGGGNSQGDAALNDAGAVLLTRRLDRILSFESDSGILVAEAGVTAGDVMRTFLLRGHMLAVCPAHHAATLGGAIATDAHGGNHVHAGSFGDHVVWLDLVTPRGELRRISRDEEPQIFEATVGGMGLTGIIVRAALRLSAVASPFVAVRRQAVGSLDALVEQLEQAAHAHEHVRAWIDALAGGLAEGRGTLETADIIPGARRTWRPARQPWSPGPWTALARILPSRLLLRALGERRYRQAKAGGPTRIAPLDRFLFQDATAAWRALHGGVGFTRFHCVVPLDGAAVAIRRLLDLARRGGGTMFATAQAMGKQGRGMLTFARPGVSLALDLPARSAPVELMHRLERETLDRGGRVLLSCDAHLTDHGFAAMYSRLDEFRAVLARIDPEMRMQSDMARRLRLRDYVV
jgi:decaprenylphospho-beta-D-ribofuranose 2-oxidase